MMTNPTTEKQDDLDALRRELEEEQAKVAALDADREKKELREKLDAVKQERLEKELIAKFEAEHGKFGRAFGMVASSKGPVFYARKERVLFKRFSNAKKVTDEVVEQFVVPCIIYPEREQFRELLDTEPGLAVSIANRLSYLYGFRKEDLEGKS